MYGRKYAGKTLTFEPSGGLMNSALVMQDRETDSYWSIMTGDVIAGELKGTKLKELPVGQKMKWKDWVKLHPNTLVLSVNGLEDVPRNVYNNYFRSNRGFRGTKARDRRLKTKESIFAFQYGDAKYAIPHKSVRNGKAFQIGDTWIFLWRPSDADIFFSTAAYKSTGAKFEKKGGVWRCGDCAFDPETATFAGGQNCPEKLEGFDTFWYNWSLTHPDTKVLK